MWEEVFPILEEVFTFCLGWLVEGAACVLSWVFNLFPKAVRDFIVTFDGFIGHYYGVILFCVLIVATGPSFCGGCWRYAKQAYADTVIDVRSKLGKQW